MLDYVHCWITYIAGLRILLVMYVARNDEDICSHIYSNPMGINCHWLHNADTS